MLPMDTGPVILDISSDEEDGPADLWYERSVDLWDKQSLDWISEMLEDPDEAQPDPDELAVLDELSCAAVVAPKQSISTAVEKGGSGDASDDDCVILEEDPDRPVSVVNDKESESDELMIVGEKGDLACRDYPHPRHLCATFPFSLTPHDQHCNQCHCYICDVVAPCAHWGNGTSTADHCHSTEKEEKWKMLRKSMKDGTALLDNAKNPTNRTPIDGASGYDLMPQTQRPLITGTLRACSNSTFQSIGIISQRRISRVASVDARLQQVRQFPHLVSATNGIRTRQGVGVQPVNPALSNSSVPSPRASYFHTSAGRPGHVTTNHNWIQRPIYSAHQAYKTHQAYKVMEPLRSRQLPVQGPGINQHPRSLKPPKHHSTIQETPPFKRQKIGFLADTPLQENQFSSKIPLDAAALKRLKDIMTGLESEIGVSNITCTNGLGTAVLPLGVHPYVPVDNIQNAGVPQAFQDSVTPPLHDSYDPFFPSIEYNASGTDLWNSNPAVTNLNTSGLGVSMAGNYFQNYAEQNLQWIPDVDAASLPFVSGSPELSNADHTSDQWESQIEPQGQPDPCVLSSHILD